MGREYASTPGCSDKYAGFNLSAPGANTGITGGIKFGATAAACRVTVALATSSVFNVTCADGTTTHKWGLNASAALNAANLYTFTFSVRNTHNGQDTGTALTYDFEVETDGVVEQLLVEEVTGAVV